MARSVMARVYIGDVGEIPEPIVHTPFPSNLDIENTSIRELFSLAIEAGIDMKLLIGRDTCNSHDKLMRMTDRLLPVGFSYAEDVIYCRNCHEYWRKRKK